MTANFPPTPPKSELMTASCHTSSTVKALPRGISVISQIFVPFPRNCRRSKSLPPLITQISNFKNFRFKIFHRKQLKLLAAVKKVSSCMSMEKFGKLLMDVRNVAKSRGEEDGFSSKPKRERPKFVRDFPFGCEPQFKKRFTGTNLVDSNAFDNPLMMTNRERCSPPKFKRVSALRSFSDGPLKHCCLPADEDVDMDDVPTNQSEAFVSNANANASLYGDGRKGNSGVVCRNIVPHVRNSSGAANSSNLANTAAHNGARDVKPICSLGEGGEMVHCETSAIRRKVKEVLQLFHDVVARLEKENKKKSSWENKESIYMAAAKHLKLQGKWLNSCKTLGPVPGIEIGDKFFYRAEMNVVGLHCQSFNGIDYMKSFGKDVAISIVASGRYSNYKSDNVLIYSGSGGNPAVRGKKRLHDQKLNGGNLALKNSIDRKTPVRVIRKESFGLKRFFYDGLYLVEKYWQERGKTGKLVFKFMLRRTKQPLPNGEVCKMVKWESSKDQAMLRNKTLAKMIDEKPLNEGGKN